ncbi:hypothetical protein Ccrd_017142, partial [Cynara cardunculus var. scolymus]
MLKWRRLSPSQLISTIFSSILPTRVFYLNNQFSRFPKTPASTFKSTVFHPNCSNLTNPRYSASNNQSVVRNFLQLPKEVRDGVGKIKNNWIIVHFKLIRMEDPESEWAIQEYPSWNEEGDMLKWILKKGYGIGKKMVITGIIVSSAPLVLPPLVVFSAMGVAFSVPFGLVFASYACTNKLMRKLLPTPEIELPLMRDEEQSEDIKQGYECLDDYRQIEGDEQGYEEDAGEYLEGDDDDSLEEERKEAMEDETEEIVKGSTGLLEKIRDEGRRNIDNESTTDPVRVKEIDSEKKLVEEASKNEEPGGEIRQEVVLAGRNEENNFNAREVERQPDNLDEEKIWEKISTMRAIVGYKAPSEATYMGELKALYVFTGIEPPASFKGDSDLDEVNANLKFLMSIVGVK